MGSRGRGGWVGVKEWVVGVKGWVVPVVVGSRGWGSRGGG